jgi:hypothetical protein
MEVVMSEESQAMSDESQREPVREPVEALPYEPLRAPAPGRRVGLVMVIGFALLGVSVFPFGLMVAEMDHYPPHENVAIFMGMVGGIITIFGLGMITGAAWEMLRR